MFSLIKKNNGPWWLLCPSCLPPCSPNQSSLAPVKPIRKVSHIPTPELTRQQQSLISDRSIKWEENRSKVFRHKLQSDSLRNHCECKRIFQTLFRSRKDNMITARALYFKNFHVGQTMIEVKNTILSHVSGYPQFGVAVEKLAGASDSRPPRQSLDSQSRQILCTIVR